MGINPKKIAKKVTRYLCNSTYRKKYKQNPKSFYTLQEICQKIGLDIDSFEEDVKCKLNTTVSQVCRYGDRFTRNCICVQLYEDTDEIMIKAINEGALVCVTDHKISGVPCIVVDKPATVYANICCLSSAISSLNTVAISGSIGKTTAKKMMEAVFKNNRNTLCDSGNANLLESIGYVCQHIPAKSEVFIAECSEDTPGMLTEMSKILKPNIVIITPVDKSHMLHYGSEEKILKEIGSIADYLDENGVCITSMDDENTAGMFKDKKVIYVSAKTKDADYFAGNILVDYDGLKFDIIEKKSGNSYKVFLKNTFGTHNVYPAMYAFAAGVESGLDYDKIINGLEKYKSMGIRQNAYKSKGVVVYADCYNAVAKSVRSAVEASQNIPVKGKYIAVLGDIAETGDLSESTHLEIADIVNQSQFKVFLAFGPQICDAVKKTTFREDLVVIPCQNRKILNANIKKYAKRGDLVLFKSSHSGHLNHSILATFTMGYIREGLKGIPPRIKWHFKMATN